MNTNFKIIRPVGFVLVFVALVGNVGCMKSPWKTPKMFSLDNTWPFGDKDAPQEGTPVRMVGTWTDTVLTEAAKKPQRGFGGRIVFYDRDGKKPILVDGQMVVYAFDEAGRDPTDNKPTRRYVFPADQMGMHMSKSELGASYSFWLPWDEAGGPRTDVSLICRFEPKGGAVVTSEQTRHVLPGPMPAVTTAGTKPPPKLPEGVPAKPMRQTLEGLQSTRATEHRARLTSYEVPVTGEPQAFGADGATQASAAPERRMTATTIALPNNFQMPDAAALNLAAAAAGYPQVAAQAPQPANAAQWQQQMAVARPNVPSMTAAPIQQTSAQPYMGPQSLQQMPVTGSQPIVMAPRGWNNMAAGQLPQPQIQQPMVGQPFLQQPALPQPMPQQTMLQQQMLQQQMMQQPMQGQQALPQMPAQAGATTAVSSPATGQLLR